MTDPKPMSWMTLEEGTEVLAADGAAIGKVTTVVADREKDIFSGIEYRHGLLGKSVFVPAEHVENITTDKVTLSLSEAETERLGPREG
jgi:uncharacterized protein YrrD